MPFVAGVDSKHALFEGVPKFSANQNHSCTLLQLSAFCISSFSRAYF
jgi:hypothetical protein